MAGCVLGSGIERGGCEVTRVSSAWSYVLTGCVSAVVTAVVLLLAIPAIAGAQTAEVQAPLVTVVDQEGHPLIRMQPMFRRLAAFSVDGKVRAGIGTGGPAANPNPSNADINTFYPDWRHADGAYGCW